MQAQPGGAQIGYAAAARARGWQCSQILNGTCGAPVTISVYIERKCQRAWRALTVSNSRRGLLLESFPCFASGRLDPNALVGSIVIVPISKNNIFDFLSRMCELPAFVWPCQMCGRKKEFCHLHMSASCFLDRISSLRLTTCSMIPVGYFRTHVRRLNSVFATSD